MDILYASLHREPVGDISIHVEVEVIAVHVLTRNHLVTIDIAQACIVTNLLRTTTHVERMLGSNNVLVENQVVPVGVGIEVGLGTVAEPTNLLLRIPLVFASSRIRVVEGLVVVFSILGLIHIFGFVRRIFGRDVAAV